MRPEPGCILVASHQLTDTSFLRSVIYLVEHGENGSLGFIINRTLDVTLNELWNEVPASLSDARIAAEGGPVDRNKGLLVHAVLDLPGAQIMGEVIAVGGDLPAIAKQWPDGSDARGPRLFLGHSGWSPGQLDNELEEGAWLLRPGKLGMLLNPHPPAHQWQHLIDGRGDGRPSPSLN